MRAAVFDLDRTLLPRASGPVISAALREVGLMGGPLPGQRLLFKMFDVIGESRASMTLAKQGPRAARGWSQAVVREAGAIAAPQLLEQVQPWARGVIERHRAGGDLLVLATTTPYDVLLPFAEALGFDHVVATRYRAVDGVYDGGVDGHFVWGPGKLKAVRELASAVGFDLSESAAYSDSYFDAPLLNDVAHPVAVNPDPRLTAVATLRGWTIRHLDTPPGVPKLLGVEPQRLLMPFLKLPQFQLGDVAVNGLEHIPDQGPAIIASNHRSYFDPLAIGYALARKGRPGRFLAKSELFESRPTRDVVAALGSIPVFRGTGSDQPLEQAAAALAAGEVVVILPQGTIPRGEKFFDPALKFKLGVGRLANLTRAPVVPLGLWGTERIWPRNSRVPQMAFPWDRPKVSIEVGPPVALEYENDRADTTRVRDAVADLLPPEAREQHTPTAEELAATLPGGNATR
ncbi:MAG: HAD-IB family hydrolase [Acidimicrobiales bacterium]